LSNRYQLNNADRPGAVTAICGVVFQSDGQSSVGRLLIRPLEALDRWIVGILPRPGESTLAMHAGIHVTIDGSHEYVVEQLVGSFYLDFKNGLNWTPIDDFRKRDRGGWDKTVPATDFRRIDQRAIDETVTRLNAIQGHPFVGEDCTAFIERAFDGRRLFADSPLLRSMGIGARIGDPALPLFRADARLEQDAARLLQFENIKELPDPLARAESPNARVWAVRLVPLLVLGGLVGRVLAGSYSSGSRRSRPASRVARKFFK
jgi:hypothetical protein